MDSLSFPLPPAIPGADPLREEVRAFLHDELAGRSAVARAESWTGTDPEFSRRLGARGWIGMTWPRRFGGGDRSPLERYVVLEELLVAGAPVGAHWFADRQSGPTLLRYASERQCIDILPRVARGECFFCVGMSEPDVGSDLAAVKTRADRERDGYRINGTKLWTTNAHIAHYMILLARTAPVSADRHAGLSQFLVDMTTPGISVKSVHLATGEHHFNEVHFSDARVPHEALIGTEGEGWAQVMSELALERSGPERFLSSFTLLAHLFQVCSRQPTDQAALALGRLAAHLVVLRRLSLSVAGAIEAGADPSLQAAIVKDAGAVFEQEIPEIARTLVGTASGDLTDPDYAAVLTYMVTHAGIFSVRGGTREILRGIITRGLGLR